MRTIKRFIILIILILIVGVAYGKIHGANAKVLARVGDSKITTTDVEFFRKFTGKLLNDEQIINILIQKEILFNEAKKSGILEKAKTEAKTQTEKTKNEDTKSVFNYAKDKVNEFLQKTGITENKYWDYVQNYFTKTIAADMESKKLDKSKIEELKKQYGVEIYK